MDINYQLTRRSRHDRRNALTLLELLVVLVILSVVATVAVNSLQPRVDTARFEKTRGLLDNIQKATVGQPESSQADGTPIITGFVADVGRLPRMPEMFSGDGISATLTELFDIEGELATSYPFQFRPGPNQPVDYSDIQLPCGWRGPYLHVDAGSKMIRDGWGREFEFEASDEGELGKLIWQPLEPFTEPLVSDLTIGKVSVTGTINSDQELPADLQVVLLAPDPEHSQSHLRVYPDEQAGPSAFAFSNVPIGLRALRISWADKKLTRYIHVPQQGLSLVIDLNKEIDSANE